MFHRVAIINHMLQFRLFVLFRYIITFDLPDTKISFQFRSLTTLLVSRPHRFNKGMINECGTVDGMQIGRLKLSTRIKLAPETICPSQIPNDLSWNRARAALLEAGESTTKSQITYNNTVRTRISGKKQLLHFLSVFDKTSRK
jgi:hypothetical protein